MRYSIKEIKVVRKQRRRVLLRAKRQRTMALCLYGAVCDYTYTEEKIRLDELFEIGELPSGTVKRKKRNGRFKCALRSVLKELQTCIELVRDELDAWLQRKSDEKIWLSFFWGALCGTLCVSVASAATVLAILFGSYLLPYTQLTVPSLVGKDLSAAENELRDGFELVVTYKSSDAEAGEILYQSPDMGTVRKYRRGTEAHKINVTVSSGKHFYTVPDLVGKTERDATLILKNETVVVKAVYEYSSSVPSGCVISTSPRTGEPVYDGESLVLRVSLGVEVVTVGVPDLYSLTEAQARELLASKGLALGEITYSQSSEAAGKIIAQQYSPYSKIEKGSSVNVTVSLGNAYAQLTVPDLYGLSVDEARERLAKYGLVLGGIYSVSSGAQKGTVVAQTPIAGTPISASITSVDIFISS